MQKNKIKSNLKNERFKKQQCKIDDNLNNDRFINLVIHNIYIKKQMRWFEWKKKIKKKIR
jgi:hypothetical protein